MQYIRFCIQILKSLQREGKGPVGLLGICNLACQVSHPAFQLFFGL